MKVIDEIRPRAGSKALAFVAVLMLSFGGLALVPGRASTATLSVVSEGYFGDILVDNSRSVLYASEVALGAVVVFDMLTDKPITTVAVGPAPHGLAMSADGSNLFVAITGGQEIAVITLDSMSVARHIPLSIAPWDIAVGAPGRLYVTATEFWGYPVVVDTVNGVEIATMTQGGLVLHGSLIKASPDGNFIYIAEMNMYPSYILKYSVAKDKVRFLGSSPFDMYGGGVDFAVGLDGYLYVPGGYYTIRVIDSSNWTIVKNVPDEIGSYRIFPAQNGGILLGTSMDNRVIAVDTATGEVLMRSSFAHMATVICADKNGGILYGITNPYSPSQGWIEKIVTGIKAPSISGTTGVMTVYGKATSLASMYFSPVIAGSWGAAVNDDGLTGVALKFYDVSSGTPVKLLAQNILFNSDRHSIKYSSIIDVLGGKNYKMTAEAIGRSAGSALVTGLFEISPNVLPVASFTISIGSCTVSVDASGSFDPDGTLVSYEWLWGDGSTSTGVESSHTYASTAPRLVTLTVTDNDGLTASLTKSYPPQPPFTIRGYTLDPNGDPLPDCSVTVTDLGTGASLSTISDSTALYMVDLSTGLGGWQVGDVVQVVATKDTLSGSMSMFLTSENTNSGFLQIDVTIPSVGPLLGWQEPTLLQSLAEYEQLGIVRMDDQGNAMVIWEQPFGGNYSAGSTGIWWIRYDHASGWGQPEILWDGDFACGNTILGIGPNGQAVAAWLAQAPPYGYSPYVSLFDPVSGWGSPTILQAGYGYSYGSMDADIDRAGNATVVVVSSPGPTLTAWRHDSVSGWQSDIIASGRADSPRFRYDANGYGLVVWNDFGDEQVKSSWYVPGHGWGPVMIASGAVGGYWVEMDIDYGGRGLAIFFKYNGTAWEMFGNLFDPVSGGWGTPTKIGPAAGGWHPFGGFVAADAEGNYFVVWEQQSSYTGGSSSVWSRTFSLLTGWGPAIMLSSGQSTSAQMFTSVAASANGEAIASWTQGDGATQHVVASRFTPGTGWGTPVNIDSSDGFPAFLSYVAMAPNGDTVVIWRQSDGVNDLLWGRAYLA